VRWITVWNIKRLWKRHTGNWTARILSIPRNNLKGPGLTVGVSFLDEKVEQVSRNNQYTKQPKINGGF